jgi:hypothetical protein
MNSEVCREDGGNLQISKDPRRLFDGGPEMCRKKPLLWAETQVYESDYNVDLFFSAD